MERDFDQSTWQPPKPEKGSQEERPEVAPHLEEVREIAPEPARPEKQANIGDQYIDLMEEELDQKIKERIIRERDDNSGQLDEKRIEEIKQEISQQIDPTGVIEKRRQRRENDKEPPTLH